MPSPTPTLTYRAALDLARSMFAPTGDDLVGLECEWPVRDWRDLTRRPELDVLESIAEPPLPGGGRITVEPGGQIELSSYPAPSVSAAIDQVNGDAEEIHGRLLSLGLDFEIRAVERCRPPQRILRKPRYQSMESFFDTRNPVGRWMMCNTASLQVNVSNDAEGDHHRWFVLNQVAPALVAMFANSRGVDAGGQQWASLRQGIWMAMDPARTQPVRTDMAPDRAWLDYALDADVMHILDPSDPGSGTGLTPGMTFKQWMAEGSNFGFPDVEDLRYHFSTLFPPVRPRGWLELRVLDALPSWMRTAAALLVTTIIQPAAASAIRTQIPDLSGLHVAAARDGFGNPVLARAIRDLTRIVLDNVETVTDRGDHLTALYGFVARYTSQGVSPGEDAFLSLPVCLADAHPASVFS
ncbi:MULTISPECIES: glutamate-cysteine ligase family protein [Mycobacteriales]|uniref:glutamate-cysteine ligase family protein n=1 Tax=Mycobacteriales TaxID=85007 RepID=UPI000B8DA55B|nr:MULTISPECIES: glutamate-cysteine ligase family protein [Mycobacteriales]ASR05581.1 Glutamate--cysteine ligase GshA [Gordonia rubripertincta]